MSNNVRIEIKKHLLKLADKKYQEFHNKLCPNTNNIIGVSVPVLRKYAKDLIQQYEIKKFIIKYR